MSDAVTVTLTAVGTAAAFACGYLATGAVRRPAGGRPAAALTGMREGWTSVCGRSAGSWCSRPR